MQRRMDPEHPRKRIKHVHIPLANNKCPQAGAPPLVPLLCGRRRGYVCSRHLLSARLESMVERFKVPQQPLSKPTAGKDIGSNT